MQIQYIYTFSQPVASSSKPNNLWPRHMKHNKHLREGGHNEVMRVSPTYFSAGERLQSNIGVHMRDASEEEFVDCMKQDIHHLYACWSRAGQVHTYLS